MLEACLMGEWIEAGDIGLEDSGLGDGGDSLVHIDAAGVLALGGMKKGTGPGHEVRGDGGGGRLEDGAECGGEIWRSEELALAECDGVFCGVCKMLDVARIDGVALLVHGGWGVEVSECSDGG